MKINIQGFNHTKTKVNKDYDVSTTSEFGYCQPVLCEETIPDSTYSLDANTLCQLSPLMSPTFGRISLHRFTAFCPASDVFHHFNEVLTGRKLTHGNATTLVSDVACVPYGFLVELLLHQQSICTIYGYPALGQTANNPNLYGPISEYTTLWTYISNYSSSTPDSLSSGPSLDLSSLYKVNIINNWAWLDGDIYRFTNQSTNRSKVVYNVNSTYVNEVGNMPTVDDADFVIVKKGTTEDIAICFRLSKYGRNLRKAFLGLGLNIDATVLTNSSHPLKGKQVSILPFLAYYKVWFDIMYPTREISFANTAAGKIISYLDAKSLSGNILEDTDIKPLLFQFFRDISEMTYIFNNDFYSSHFTNLGTTSDYASIPTGDGATITTNTSTTTSSSANIRSSVLKLITAVNNFELSGKVIGKKFQDFLKQYGVVTNDDESNYIGSDVLNIDTGSVLATTENENTFLGQKAGHGEGRKFGSRFKFTAKEHGYLISFICIVPKSNFSQGLNPMLLRTSRYDFYNQQFDGIGYTITPGYSLFASNDCAKIGESFSVSNVGYTGRYNNYKYAINIANGDFTRRPTREMIGSFYLDRRFPQYEVRTLKRNGILQWSAQNTSIDYSQPRIPSQPTALRFCDSDMYDYNRIFVSRDDTSFDDYRRIFDPTDDHFTIQIVNDFKCFMPVLPISDTLGTDDLVDSKSETSSVTLS